MSDYGWTLYVDSQLEAYDKICFETQKLAGLNPKEPDCDCEEMPCYKICPFIPQSR